MTDQLSFRQNGKPFITLDNVTLRLPEGAASPPISWQIRSDEQWAVLGPNGCGKSTLMKALCGQTPVAGGRIIYHFAADGCTVPPPASLAYVTFAAQRASLGNRDLFYQARWNSGIEQDTLSVSEYLSERRVKQINPYQVVVDPQPSGFAAHRKRVIELLGIGPLLDRTMIQISNGERRKVFMARALLKNPRLLILDNPFTGLDAGFRSRLVDIIEDLTGQGMRVVLVSNEPDTMPPSISHVLLMDSWRVTGQGPRRAKRAAHRPAPVPSQSMPSPPSPPAPQRKKGAGAPAQPDILVQMTDLSVTYNGTRILSGINWTVRRGENWALLGPNGAGKTTLLSLILGDNPQAYANDVILFGRRRGSGESIWEIKRRIGWVAPELQLYHPQGLACLDIVCSGFFDSIGHQGRCSSEQRKTALEWLARLGVARYADTVWGRLSEGEQRLVLVARALVKQPLLLVLDEPCQGLDANHRQRVLQAVTDAGNLLDGSIIYVSHHLDPLPGFVTHVLNLRAGQVASAGAAVGYNAQPLSQGFTPSDVSRRRRIRYGREWG